MPVAAAQDTADDLDPHPLRPADTSSPRDTLQRFLTNANETIEGWRRGAVRSSTYRAYRRAVQALDFSATPNGHTWVVRTRRVLLLNEILGRIELPPAAEIPGDREVADQDIEKWTIPNTRITIARIEDGPRAGEFLFSADTVENLDRLYRQVKHLPYKPGATVGIYEDYVRSDTTATARQMKMRLRLKSVDTSSPRSTLEGFLDSVNRAHTLIMEADAALKTSPPTMTREQALEIATSANNLLERAIDSLDLSQVPQALRKDVGVETVLLLKEIFDRSLLPPLDSIPNAHMVATARRGAGGSLSQAAGPIRWRYPNTEIDIVEIMEGERRGQFLFSAGTVSRAGLFSSPYASGYDSALSGLRALM